jgi:cyclophilin family peptidyl-prolyl cis-trans isomerase
MKKKKKSINSCYICFCLGLHVVVLQGLIAWLSDEPNHEPFFKASPNVASQNRIQCVTTKGNFEVELRPDLAPNGVQRLKEMVDIGFFDQGISFFRVNQWMTQFGADQLPQHRKDSDPYSSVRSTFPTDVHPDLIASRQRKDPKDLNQTGLVPKPPKSLSPWKRGTLALIGGTQMVVVTTPNPHMGTQSYDAPAGFVDSKGMDTVFSNLHRYNDVINNPTGDPGPKQEGIFQEGMEYITREFPQTDIIKSCSFVPKKGVL